ncbi:MAG: sulfatase-like hydrolase/transferase [Planctomycetaceae bacterium]|nr:sulfatase-like hydrolase/transferase [Planctomycetaceae bacterium]
MGSTAPNILLILSDQQHFGTLGAVNERIRTPALDRLCAEGTRFDRAYCPNPTCTPTRASLITGLYPSQHGAWALGTKLPQSVPTVGEALKGADYDTALIGKAHFQPLASRPPWESIECQPTLRDLDFWRNFHGPWYGFEHLETARMHGTESHVGGHYALWMQEQGLENWADYFDSYPVNVARRGSFDRDGHWTLPERFHYNRWITQRSVEAIHRAQDRGRPFFLSVNHFDPHPPYVVPKPWASMYRPQDMAPGALTPGEHDRNPRHFAMTQQHDPDFQAFGDAWVHGGHSHLVDRQTLQRQMAVYYGMVSFMDACIGELLATLDALGLTENTLVVFTTDHGHFLGQHGLTAKAIHHYEDLIRVPMIARWPGRIPAARVSSALQNLVDYSPTFLAAAGLDVPEAMTGVNQLPAWQGAGAVRTWSITENHHGRRHFHMRTYVEDRYKITVYARGDEGELFDLQEDPAELNNLWSDPAAAPVKSQLLQRFLQATMQYEHMPMPRIAGA